MLSDERKTVNKARLFSEASAVTPALAHHEDDQHQHERRKCLSFHKVVL